MTFVHVYIAPYKAATVEEARRLMQLQYPTGIIGHIRHAASGAWYSMAQID